MSITDYETLKSTAQAFAARSDTTFAARFPVFVSMAEDRLYYGAGTPGAADYTPALRSSTMELTTAITAASGEATLPADYLEARSIAVEDQRTGIEYMPPERWDIYNVNSSATSTPVYYTVKGTSLWLTPSYSGDVNLSYYRSFDRITPTNTSEALIEAHGNLYLYLVLFEAFAFMEDVELSMAYLMRARSAIEGVNSNASLRRFPGPLRIRPRVVMP